MSFVLLLAGSPADRQASKYYRLSRERFFFLIFFLVVRTTRTDPRSNRKQSHNRHQSSQDYFVDADERTQRTNSNSSSITNGETKTTPMIDVNLITDLLIQHSQSTGFEKSLEMLTQTLKQLTESNAQQSTVAASLPSQSANPFESLLMKRLQPPIAPPVLPPPVAPQVWFNTTTPPQTFPASVPPFFPPNNQRSTNTSVDFHSQQQYPNQRN